MLLQAYNDENGAKFEVAAAVATSSTSSQEEPGKYRPGPTAVRVESNEEEGYEIGISAQHNISLTRYYSATVTAEVMAAPSPKATASKAPKAAASTAAWVANSLEDFSESSQETVTAAAVAAADWVPYTLEDFSVGDDDAAAQFKFTF